MLPKDPAVELLVAALRLALNAGGEHRLFRAGKLDGLFAGKTGIAGEMATRALEQGLLQRARIETKGKTEIEWVTLTPAGVEWLHAHESPIIALHELRGHLRASRNALPDWLAQMSQTLVNLQDRITQEAASWNERLLKMETQLEQTLRRLESALPIAPPEVLQVHPWTMDALNYLDRRRTAGAVQPCPFPELFSALLNAHPSISIGTFHDGLRRLHQRRAIELRPSEDPMDMAQPEFALLEGDCVYYLAWR
jgi:hypothetical protein